MKKINKTIAGLVMAGALLSKPLEAFEHWVEDGRDHIRIFQSDIDSMYNPDLGHFLKIFNGVQNFKDEVFHLGEDLVVKNGLANLEKSQWFYGDGNSISYGGEHLFKLNEDNRIVDLGILSRQHFFPTMGLNCEYVKDYVVADNFFDGKNNPNAVAISTGGTTEQNLSVIDAQGTLRNIHGNVIYGFGYGIQSINSEDRIDGNTITDCEIGIRQRESLERVVSVGDLEIEGSGLNIFSNNVVYDISNLSDKPVMAQNNIWENEPKLEGYVILNPIDTPELPEIKPVCAISEVIRHKTEARKVRDYALKNNLGRKAVAMYHRRER